MGEGRDCSSVSVSASPQTQRGENQQCQESGGSPSKDVCWTVNKEVKCNLGVNTLIILDELP